MASRIMGWVGACTLALVCFVFPWLTIAAVFLCVFILVIYAKAKGGA